MQMAVHTDGGSGRELAREMGWDDDWIRHAHGQAVGRDHVAVRPAEFVSVRCV